MGNGRKYNGDIMKKIKEGLYVLLAIVIIVAIISIFMEFNKEVITSTTTIPSKPEKMNQILYDEINVGKLWPDKNVLTIVRLNVPYNNIADILKSVHKGIFSAISMDGKTISLNATAKELFRIAEYEWVDIIELDGVKPHLLGS